MILSDVGSSQRGAEEGSKRMAVRHLKRYVSWVQTVQHISDFVKSVGVVYGLNPEERIRE